MKSEKAPWQKKTTSAKQISKIASICLKLFFKKNFWRFTDGVTLKRVVLCRTLEVQHISLMECMESCGAPMSNTGTPRRAARIGPMVVPHGLSLRTITSCRRRRETSDCPDGGTAPLITYRSVISLLVICHFSLTTCDIWWWFRYFLCVFLSLLQLETKTCF